MLPGALGAGPGLRQSACLSLQRGTDAAGPLLAILATPVSSQIALPIPSQAMPMYV